MAAPMINATRFTEAKNGRRSAEVTDKSFPVDLHTVEGIRLYAQLWAFAGRAPRYQRYTPATDTVEYLFDVTGRDKTAILVAADYARECGYDVEVEETTDKWGGAREFTAVRVRPTN